MFTNIVTRTKSAVRRNKHAIVVASITIPVIYLQSKGIKSLNAFLIENDLFEKYYYDEVLS